jgi:sugar O-acyltransferase (sialic acid O-acetyltransferase NeuD family)
MKKRLVIIGAGDLGLQILHHSNTIGEFTPVGFIDDKLVGQIKFGIPVIGKIDDVYKFFKEGKFDCIIIGIGYGHFNLRESVFNMFFGLIPFATIIHPSSIIDNTSKIASGVIIYPGCIIDSNVVINENVLVNVGCVIAHDSIIDQHSFLSPNVSIAGFVKVGKCVKLGIGSILIDNIKVNDWVRIGAGAVVINSLDEEGLYVGIPASFKKK